MISNQDNILRIEGIKTKVDVLRVSDSIAILLGSYEEALIVQQLHSRTLEGHGVVIGGNHWFDESIKDWLGEVFPIISQKKMNSYLKSLIAKGVVEREHLEPEDNSHNYSSKKRTYYYRLNYENLFNLANELG